MHNILSQIYQNLLNTSALEFIAVIAGIVSVVFSKKENILVYPTGLVNTVIFIYLSIKSGLLGEALVNLYYTIMSIYGWWMWTRRNQEHQIVLHISRSTQKEKTRQISFFLACYCAIFFLWYWKNKGLAPGLTPWVDTFAGATAFTGMWMMANKKLESWHWWIATNIFSIPLWYVKGFAFTSIQFVILLLLAIAGLMEWKRRLKKQLLVEQP